MIPKIRHPVGFAGPDWITVLRVVTHLPDEAHVTRDVFKASGNLRQWEWAVRERNEGQVDGRRRDSPWLAFVAGGQTAAVVRENLAGWATFCDLGAIPASVVAALQRDTAVDDEWHAEVRLWAALVQDPLYLKKQEQLAIPTVVIAPRIPASAEALFALLRRIDEDGGAETRDTTRSPGTAGISKPSGHHR